MTDGVFSVRGTIAPLADYGAVLANYPGAGLLVDDAHGVGVLGNHGRGTLEHFGLFDDSVNADFSAASPLSSREEGIKGSGVLSEKRLPTPLSPLFPRRFLCATLSKALGGFGGIIPGSQEFVELVRRRSHWYDGATPAPTPVAAASARALELVRGQS